MRHRTAIPIRWVCLLSEAQPEFIISKRLCRVLKELALRQSRDATLTVVNVAFRDAGAGQQRGYRDVPFAKNRNRLSSGEPVALVRVPTLFPR